MTMDNEDRTPGSAAEHHAHHHNDFRTPQQIATETTDKSYEASSESEHKDLKTKKIHKRLWNKFRDLSTRRKVILIVVLVLILAGLGLIIHQAFHKKPVTTAAVVQIVKPKPAAQPATVASNLTGLQVSPSVNQRPVTGIMIENSLDARPQSGIIDAGVVFEAIAEGGVTRFLTLFQDTQPSYIGPVRSLRPYYLSWDMGFDAPIAHVGGSPDALSDIGTWGGKDLDEFSNGSYYQRISSRQAPHNVYTSISQLNTLEAKKGWTSSTYTSFPRKADSPAKNPTVTGIDLNLSGPDYNPHYAYNAATNSYNRSQLGAPMTDQQSGAQISPKVVIAIVVPLSQGALDASGAYYSDYSFIGSGTAYVFQDGGVTIGTWQKTSNTSQITFTNPNGTPITLNAGQTWITAVGTSSDVSY